MEIENYKSYFFDVFKLMNFDNGLSLNTSRTYAYLIGKFKRDYLEMFDLSIGQVGKQTIIDYMQYLKAQGAKNTSINNSIKALKRFYNSMIDKGVISENPCQGVAYFKESQIDKTNKYKWLDEKTIKKIYLELKKDTSEIGLRNYAIFRFLALTGLRASELCSLKFKDIIYSSGKPIEVRFIGKGAEDRVIDIDMDILAPVITYRASAGLPCGPDDYLFETTLNNRWKERKPLNRMALFYIIRTIGRAAGIPNLHPHNLRHTNITNLIKSKCPLHRVQSHAGHKSINETISYYCHDDSRIDKYNKKLR